MLVNTPLLLQTEGMVTVDAEQLVTLVTFVATSLAVVAYLNRGLASLGDRIDKLDAKIDSLDARLTDRIDRLDAKLEATSAEHAARTDRLEMSLRAEMRAGFASIDTRFLVLESRFTTLEGRYTALESRLYELVTGLPSHTPAPPAAH